MSKALDILFVPSTMLESGMIEVKVNSHINKETYCIERCELGNKQISVAPDGGLFPCVQFVGSEQYCIGNVDTCPPFHPPASPEEYLQ
jgi:sulfatase maturation enzyme AslB (radical SAM superfamily)